MSYLPKSTLEEIYFKTIIPSITYGISVWGNCSQSLLNSLDHIHARACRIINRLPSSQESSSCLLQCNWLPINYLYKRCILLKMHQIFVGAAPSQILDMFSISSRSTRFCNQFNIIRVKSELGRSSLQYRGPNIWNFINKKVKICNVSKEGFKAILRKYSKEILNFSFNKEAIVISNKKDDFIYYYSYMFIKSTIKFIYYSLLSILIYICLQMYSIGYVEYPYGSFLVIRHME